MKRRYLHRYRILLLSISVIWICLLDSGFASLCLTYCHLLSHLYKYMFPLLLLEVTWLFIPKAVGLGCIFFCGIL